jgi:NAD(P)-dependent dehydrogenase (short-subunit alcohol dehydrogenase family)
LTDLNGRCALVTGGTRGIGAAVARKLSEAGARVVVSARSRGDYDGAARFIPADLSTPDGPPRLAAQALEDLGGIDILVDNAASQTVVPDGVLAMTDGDWLADLTSSLMSAVRLDRVVVPGMIAAGGGAVVHIGSNAARLPRPARRARHFPRLPVSQLPHRHEPRHRRGTAPHRIDAFITGAVQRPGYPGRCFANAAE